MSATLIGNNVTLKTSAAISATKSVNTAGTATDTLYTAPVTGYAIINLFVTAFASTQLVVSIGGRTSLITAAVDTASRTFYVGPSQSVVITVTGAAGVTTVVTSGVEFINTP